MDMTTIKKQLHRLIDLGVDTIEVGGLDIVLSVKDRRDLVPILSIADIIKSYHSSEDNEKKVSAVLLYIIKLYYFS